MSYTTKPFEDLDIMDDFLINAAADDDEVGEEFSRTLLKGLLQRELGEIQVSIQKVVFANTPNHRGVRLDVNLPKHNRFYQAKIDSRNLTSGEKEYDKLPNLFVLMITDYDPFGYDYMVYTVHNKCEEVPELNYEDGLMFIYFNTTGTQGGNPSIKKLLNFIEDSTINNVTDEVTKKLHDCINKVKVSPEVRMEYMKWDAMIYYERRDAKNEGKIEGKIEYILELLEDIGEVPEELRDMISRESNPEKLKLWHKLAAKVNSIEEFQQKM